MYYFYMEALKFCRLIGHNLKLSWSHLIWWLQLNFQLCLFFLQNFQASVIKVKCKNIAEYLFWHSGTLHRLHRIPIWRAQTVSIAQCSRSQPTLNLNMFPFQILIQYLVFGKTLNNPSESKLCNNFLQKGKGSGNKEKIKFIKAENRKFRLKFGNQFSSSPPQPTSWELLELIGLKGSVCTHYHIIGSQ